MPHRDHVHWPERFPILRVVFALVAVPLLVTTVLSGVGTVLDNRLPPGDSREPLPAFLGHFLFTACLVSLPQIVAALVLGVPVAYLLYRRRQSGWLPFITVGMICEPVGYISFEWLVLVSREAFWHTFRGVPLLMALGAVTGSLVRVFMLFPVSSRVLKSEV